MTYSVPTADPDYAQFIAQHGSTAGAGIVYEAKRATRQMTHYFDVTQYRKRLDTQPAASTSAPKKVSKQDLERFKKRKEERKRIRHKWLYE